MNHYYPNDRVDYRDGERIIARSEPESKGPVLRSVFDGLPAGVRYLEPRHLDRTVSDVDRLDELYDESIARQTGEHRGGAAVSHHSCLGYADVP